MEALSNMTTTNPYYFPVVIVPLLYLGLSTKVGKPCTAYDAPIQAISSISCSEATVDTF